MHHDDKKPMILKFTMDIYFELKLCPSSGPAHYDVYIDTMVSPNQETYKQYEKQYVEWARKIDKNYARYSRWGGGGPLCYDHRNYHNLN